MKTKITEEQLNALAAGTPDERALYVKLFAKLVSKNLQKKIKSMRKEMTKPKMISLTK